ncbi:hypothetical protein ASZ90_010194 [hydrocarbon metagenome]|uniref:Uncharacterized protein n=1 Tax=hydrocarbon metagenome TaxID=938273 RepID=A0A0W8FGR5_9ZZZZ
MAHRVTIDFSASALYREAGEADTPFLLSPHCGRGIRIPEAMLPP